MGTNMILYSIIDKQRLEGTWLQPDERIGHGQQQCGARPWLTTSPASCAEGVLHPTPQF
jgi:hypothetical protein